MKPASLETTDIYKSAVFLCNGGRLADVRFKEDKRGIVSFLIEGEDILEVDLEYRHGRVQVNALEFRHTLNHLRDVLFTRLREKSPSRSRRDRDAAGRRCDDTQRRDRGHQTRR